MSRSVGTDRHALRERVIALLYEAEMRGEPPADVVAGLDVAPDPFVVERVEGVAQAVAQLDVLIREHLTPTWPFERLGVMDRIICRLGTWELVHAPDVPTAVILDEMVELAKAYGATDDAGKLVNGVLAAVTRDVRPG